MSVELDPRADGNPLAREIRRRVVANLDHGGSTRSFRRMWGTVVVVAVSRDGAFHDAAGGTGRASSTHTTLTLRFDWGRLMIHEGRVGRPDVTLWGSPEAILAWGTRGRLRDSVGDVSDAPLEEVQGRWRAQALRWWRAQEIGQAWSSRVAAGRNERATDAAAQELKIYGAVLRPRFVWRLRRLLGER